ncbi:phage tail protein [Pseudomonas asplenii]|uniref:phage tail protein n=1 Tax=Pseudomonas asplenii TaxID=53407 RepID=UPI00037B3BEA|nr:phage tail protein [Pseudomonas fuscovaginae]
MDYPKSTPSVGLVNGRFVDENPVNGSPGSLIPAVWGNAVTEELLNVVQAGGLEPAEAEHDQLLRAIRTIIQSSLPPEQIRTTLAAYGITDAYTKAEVEALFKNATALPVGAMMAFPKGVVPNGFLEVDGSVQSVATYPDLAAYLGTTFNKGDEGAGNFRLPESRGEFLRGWDHGRGVDAGRGIGTFQVDQFKSHTHGLKTNQAAAGGGFTTLYNSGNQMDDGSTYIQPQGGAETRPRNLAVMWCIKAWNAPVNQGQIDVGALVDEVQKLKASVPVGSMLSFPKGTVPPGYLEVDGSLQSSAAYPDLAAYLGTTFNKGDEPAGYFRLPESRGEFLRGWDHGRGVDGGRTIGSYQLDDFKSHKHSLNADVVTETGAGPVGGIASSGNIYITETAFTGGAETRPRNLSVMWCIKAWNSPVNQGSIDVAALAADVRTVQKIAVAGTFRGLTASANGLGSVVNVAADQLVLGNDVSSRVLNGVNVSINATAMGANGLDTGGVTASTWYSVWVIWGGSGVAGLLSLSANNPVLPAGFTHKARVTWTRTDSTANKFLLSFVQAGNSVQYKIAAGSNVPNLPVMASGTVSPAADVSISAFVPPTASKIALAAGSTGSYISFAPSSAYTAQVQSYLSTGALNAAPFVGGYNPSSPVPTANGLILIEGSSIRFGSSGGSGVLQCLGWEDNL